MHLQLRFARAIARSREPRALLLTRDNDGEAWVPLAEAVGRAAAVEVADHILAVDCDVPDLASRVWQLHDELVTAGLLPVVLASGGEGRFHLFVAVRDLDARDEWKALARESGLDVIKTIRPPLWLHRSGTTRSYLLSPEDPEEALARLEVDPEDRLPPDIYDLLLFGDRGGRYEGRSRVEAAIILSMVNHGWSLARVKAVFMNPKNLGAAKTQEILRTRGRLAAERNLERTYEKMRSRVQTHPPTAGAADARREIAQIRTAAGAVAWPGRTGGTDWAVLEALLHIAERTGKVEIGASVRELAQESGVHASTVSRALDRLGWVQRVRAADGGKAAVWRLRIPSDIAATLSLCPPEREECCAPVRGHDAFRHGGLGPSVRGTWRLLRTDEAISIQELVQRRGLSERSIRRHLSRLADSDLAVRDGGGGWRRGDGDLDAAAEVLGTSGKGEREKAKHARERENFNAYLQERHRAHAKPPTSRAPGPSSPPARPPSSRWQPGAPP